METAERQHFILDTSVIVEEPEILSSLKNAHIFIPMEVLEELDHLKTQLDEAGFNARKANKILDAIRQEGSLSDGVLYEDSFVQVLNWPHMLMEGLKDIVDNRIISYAVALSQMPIYGNIICLSNDIALRVKCDAMGVKSSAGISAFAGLERYTGMMEIEAERQLVDLFYDDGVLNFKEELFYPNQFVTIRGDTKTAIAIASSKTSLKQLVYNSRGTKNKKFSAEGVVPKSRNQIFAMELLLDKNIPLITINGFAGCGKTLLSIACAMKQLHEKSYDKIVLARPAESTSKDLGALPGPLTKDTKVLTPNGWILMGNLKVDDFVIGRNGKATRVIGVYNKGEKEVFLLETRDGAKIKCCADHPWETRTFEEKKRGRKGSVRSTFEIMNTLMTKEGRKNHFLPRNDMVEFSKKDLPIPPYTLGVLLGDGSVTNTISFASFDAEIHERVREELAPLGCTVTEPYKNGGCNIYNTEKLYNSKPGLNVKVTDQHSGECTVFNTTGHLLQDPNHSWIKRGTVHSLCKQGYIRNNYKYEFGERQARWSNKIKNLIYELGLSGVYSDTKFIPRSYMYTSVEQRIALLQGLMDTDGTVKKNGEASFCTTSYQLALDVVELVRSLGGNAKVRGPRDRRGRVSIINGHEATTRLISYEFNISFMNDINPFYLSRKAERVSNRASTHLNTIDSITLFGKEEVMCIQVEDPEHLYIIQDYTVTHNSLQEKLQPWLMPFFDNLEVILKSKGNSYIELMIDKGVIEMAAISHIRGRSLPNTFFIVDEAQNITEQEAKAIITRMGENSKLVLIGDLEQIDSKKITPMSSGLNAVISKFKDTPLAGHITLTRGERSDLATYAAKVM